MQLKVKSMVDKTFKFYISAAYNFDKRIWKSWWLEIEDHRWQNSTTTDYKYPTLDDLLFLYTSAWDSGG